MEFTLSNVDRRTRTTARRFDSLSTGLTFNSAATHSLPVQALSAEYAQGRRARGSAGDRCGRGS